MFNLIVSALIGMSAQAPHTQTLTMPTVVIVGHPQQKAFTCGRFHPTALGTQVRDCEWR